MTEMERLEETIEWNDGNDPIEPEKTRFFAMLVMVLAVAAMTFGAISAYRAMFPPPETHTQSGSRTVILRDATTRTITIHVTYQVSGMWINENLEALVILDAYLATYEVVPNFDTERFTNYPNEFVAQVREKLDVRIHRLDRLYDGGSGYIKLVDLRIDIGNFRKNSV